MPLKFTFGPNGTWVFLFEDYPNCTPGCPKFFAWYGRASREAMQSLTSEIARHAYRPVLIKYWGIFVRERSTL